MWNPACRQITGAGKKKEKRTLREMTFANDWKFGHIRGIIWRQLFSKPFSKKKDSPSLSPCALFECFAWVFLIWRVKKSVRGCSGNKLDSIKLESVDLEPRIDKQPNRAESATKSANICALQLAWLGMLSDTAQHSAGVCSILGWGLSPHNKDYSFLGRWN